MIIKDVEIWYCKVIPNRPNRRLNKENPTWEVQIRTHSRDVKKDWEAKHLYIKAIVPDVGDPYFRVNLKKNSLKKEPLNDGSGGFKMVQAKPIEVINGKGEEIDPRTIGNGSIANIRVWQREYTDNAGNIRIQTILDKIQIKKHLKYEPRQREDEEFEEFETEVIPLTPAVEKAPETVKSGGTPSVPKEAADSDY